MYLNKAQIIGNLTRDPELKALPTGQSVCNFSIATNRVYKDSNNNKKEETEFHNVVVFGKQADTSSTYLKKGQQVYVEGRIATRSWDDKTSGEKKYRTEIIADTVQFGQRTEATTNAQVETAPVIPSGYNGEANPEDIPF